MLEVIAGVDGYDPRQYNVKTQRYREALPIPAPEASREEYVQRSNEMIANTAPFDFTHHPAMAIPCGMSEGLPVSLQLIGKHFDESTIYRAAHGFQEGTDWKEM